MKRSVLIVAVAVLLACVGGAMYMQNAKKEEVRRFIDQLPGTLAAERIDVPLFGNRIEIHNLSGLFTFFEEAPYEVKAEMLILEGVNRKATGSSGVVKLVDRIRTKNFSLNAKGDAYPLLWKEVQDEGSDTQGFWLDMDALKAITGLADEHFINAMLSARFGPSTCGKTRYAWLSVRDGYGPGTGGNLCTMTMESGSAESYSLLEFGKAAYTGVTLTEEGVYSVKAKEWGITSGKTPRAVYTVASKGSLGTDEALVLVPQMVQEGYSLRGMRAADLEISIDGVPGVIRAPRLDADIALNTKEILFRIESASLLVPGSMAALLSPELAFLERDMDELNLKALLDVTTTIESADKGAIRCAIELSEPELGEFRNAFTLGGRPFSGPGAYLPLDTASIGFAGSTSSMTDRNFLKLFYADAPGDTPGAGAARRAAMAAQLRTEDEYDQGLPLEAFRKLADFIEKSGTYELDVTVTAPVSFMSLMWDPESVARALIYEVRHQPAQ